MWKKLTGDDKWYLTYVKELGNPCNFFGQFGMRFMFGTCGGHGVTKLCRWIEKMNTRWLIPHETHWPFLLVVHSEVNHPTKHYLSNH